MKSSQPLKSGGMAPKQKIMLVAFILICLFLIWQVMGMFGGKSSTPAPTQKAVSTVRSSTSTTQTKNGAPQVAQGMQPPGQAPQATTPRPAPNSQLDPLLLKIQQETQTKYVEALNDLQMLRIQKNIAETNQAIMKAKLEVVKAEKGITDLLTKPQAPQVPASAYANRLVGPGGEAIPAPPEAGTAAAPAQPTEPSYVVISVSMQQNRWMAVLGYQGKLFNVSIGDVLPIDGSKVIAIDRSGVTLKRDDTVKKISLLSSI